LYLHWEERVGGRWGDREPDRPGPGGDGEAFRQLTDPYQRELLVHFYRILGSLQDAEDAVQETLLATWQGHSCFEERDRYATRRRCWRITMAEPISQVGTAQMGALMSGQATNATDGADQHAALRGHQGMGMRTLLMT
jgi:hypothetical protein